MLVWIGWESKVRTFLIAAVCISFSFSLARAGCEADHNALLAEIQRISSSAGSMGICQAARALVSVYGQASSLLQRCPILDPTGQDAATYARAAEDAQATANAACAN